MGRVDISAVGRRHLLQMGPCLAAACLAAPLATSVATPLAAQEATPRATDDAVGTVWWVELVSSNGGPALDFYKSTLKWGAHTAPASGSEPPASASPPYTLFEAGGSEVAGAVVAQPSDPAKSRPLWIVYFRVDDVERSIGRALAVGGRLLQVPYDVPGSARMAVLADLDGTPFGVAAPLPA